jgi:type I restriction enzyme S subunit
VGRYIHAKQRLIELLGEQRNIIIQQAVTRGLDARVRLRPSGIDLVDDVPEHWQIIALKWVLSRLIDCEHKTAPAVDRSEFRVMRTTAVKNGSLRISGTYCTTETAFNQWTRRGVPEQGDVVFTREAPAGEACIVPADMKLCLGQRTVLMKVNQKIYDSEFLIHMIYAGPPRVRIRLASQGSTVGHFNMDDIGSLYVLAPPLHEQREIVASIEAATRSTVLIAEAAEREISLLREYRTRLITGVVTGKLDVREAAANLPDDLEEPNELPLLDEALEEGDDGELTSDELAEEVG